MDDLYIYKIVEEYYSIKNEKIPKKVLSLLKRVEPYLKDISDFLEELQLECYVTIPKGVTHQFEFKRAINNYKVTFGLDCVAEEFWFSIADASHCVFPDHAVHWTSTHNVELLRKQLSDWIDS